MTKLDKFKRVTPVIDYSMRHLCTRQYAGHPQGCPNYGKKEGCPPHCKRIENIINLRRPIYVIWNKFALADHVARMKELHPLWSWRQLVCCLYWQPRARKQLKANTELFLSHYPNYTIIPNPEGAGVNVTKTMRQINIYLQWPPKTITYQIALAGVPLYKSK